MKKTLVALLMCLAACTVPAQAAAPANPPASAVESAQGDSSTAQEFGRLIGAWMKRAADVLRDIGQGISEGFKSAPSGTDSPEACSAEQEKAGKCRQPAPETETGAGVASKDGNAPPPEESPGLFKRLLRALLF